MVQRMSSKLGMFTVGLVAVVATIRVSGVATALIHESNGSVGEEHGGSGGGGKGSFGGNRSSASDDIGDGH